MRNGVMYYELIQVLPLFLQKAIMSVVRTYLNILWFCTRIPRRIILFVTNRCTVDCGYCFYSNQLNKPIGELTSEEIKKLFSPLKGKIASVNITGGEPFLRDDLFEIVTILYETKIYHITINTNGVLLDRIIQLMNKIDRYKKLHLNLVLSYHSDRNNTIETYRTMFEDTARRLFDLEKTMKYFRVEILGTVSSKNIHELLYLVNTFPRGKVNINLFRDYASCVWKMPTSVRSDFRHKDMQHTPLSIERIGQIITLVRDTYTHSPRQELLLRKLAYSQWIMRYKQRLLKCYAGTLEAVVYPDGAVSFCEHAQPVGNIRNNGYDIRSLWASRVADQRRKELSLCACLLSCNMKFALAMDTRRFNNSLITDGHTFYDTHNLLCKEKNDG